MTPPSAETTDQSTKSPGRTLLDELSQRQLYHQCTDEDGLIEHLDRAISQGIPGGVKLYNGFDPTADSLTIGNLVPIMLLRRFRDAGHTPIVLVGGATGLIGDPSGKESERSLRSREDIEANIAGQTPIFRSLLGDDVRIVNNDDWFRQMDAYTFLRDVGKYFSVSQMIQRDSVKNRLEREQGISYTEFSYMLLQAWDFWHLFSNVGVSLQTAGADQWGNIVSGVDLVRRQMHVRTSLLDLDQKATGDEFGDKREDYHTLIRNVNVSLQRLAQLHVYDPETRAAPTFGFTAPLLTKSDGGKFGKTESGAIWLSADRTSPYAYHQFWLNTADDDISKYLRIFTDLPLAEIAEIEQRHAEAPHKREAQKTLADHATTLLHGEAETERANAAARALFSGDVATLDERTIAEVFAGVPTTTHDRSLLDPAADQGDPIELLAQSSLASSKSEARKHLAANAIAINGEKIDADTKLTTGHLLHGRYLLLRRGKKNWHVCVFE